jgi:hypothetical protein
MPNLLANASVRVLSRAKLMDSVQLYVRLLRSLLSSFAYSTLNFAPMI